MLRTLSNGQFVFNLKGKIVRFDVRDVSTQPDIKGNQPFTLNDQIWSFTRLDDGRYTVTDQRGRALTSTQSLSFDLEKYTGAEEQKFTVICNKDGSYCLTQGTTCAAFYALSSDTEAEMEVDLLTGDDSEKFVLEPVIPEELANLKGDITGDGRIAIGDLVLLQRYLLKLETVIDNEAADINEDGVIDIFDNIRLRKLIISQT